MKLEIFKLTILLFYLNINFRSKYVFFCKFMIYIKKDKKTSINKFGILSTNSFPSDNMSKLNIPKG